MHYLPLIYFVKQPLHVSGVFIAHHQEVFTVLVQQLVRVTRLGDRLLAGSGWGSILTSVLTFRNVDNVPDYTVTRLI
jgi:hypothetical protein